MLILSSAGIIHFIPVNKIEFLFKVDKISKSQKSNPQKHANYFQYNHTTVRTLRGEEINPYSIEHSGMHYANTIRGVTAEEFDKTGFKIPIIDFSAGDIYQTAMSLGDSWLAIGLGGKLGGTLLASTAASNEAYRLYQAGATNEQIAWGSAAAGAAELIFETFSIEKLIDIGDAETVGQWVRNELIQGGFEASEEALTEISNTVTNAIVMGSNSDWNKLVAENGGSEWKAFLGLVQQTVQAGFGGFISGSISGLAFGKSSLNENYRNAKILYGDNPMGLVDATLELDPENRYAQYVKSYIEKGKTPSGKSLYKLSRQLDSAVTSTDIGRIQEAVQGRLTELGDTGNLEVLSAAIAKQTAGQKLSRAEMNAIADSKYGQRVLNELDPENIKSGETSSEWATRIGTLSVNPEAYTQGSILDAETDYDTETDGPEAVTGEDIEVTEETDGETNVPAKTELPVNMEVSDDTADADAYSSAKASKISDPQMVEDHMVYYNAGFSSRYTGKTAESVNSRWNTLTEAQKKSAFEAGRRAAESMLEKGKTTSFVNKGEEAGLVDSPDAASLRKYNPRAYNAMDKLAKSMGVKILVDNKLPDSINGSIKDGVIRLNSRALTSYNRAKTISRILAHEVTHRFKEVAPEAYAEFRDYALRAVAKNTDLDAVIRKYKERYAPYEKLTTEEAMDEIAADYIGMFITDTSLYKSFVAESKKIAASAKRCWMRCGMFLKKSGACSRGNAPGMPPARKAWVWDTIRPRRRWPFGKRPWLRRRRR